MCKTNMEINLYYANICKHEHEKNMTRLWCKIVFKTIVEQTERVEGSYYYLYPFGDLAQVSFHESFCVKLVGTCDLRTLWSPLVSLNCIYFEETFCFKQLNCPSADIYCTLLFRSSIVPFPSKTVPMDMRVLQRGLLFLFVHWFNDGYCVEGGR
jgi:hypothetical protein